MKSLIRSAVALAAAFTLGFAAPVPDEIRGNLDKLVPEAIRLIEAKEYVLLIETLATPDDIKNINSNGGVAKVAEEFGKENAPELLAVLKSLKDKKPKLSEDGNTATYSLEDIPDVHKKEIVFTKIEGRWYIKD